jgi:7,8-dihydroneopterin aldolase/epimerase/oxygenase
MKTTVSISGAEFFAYHGFHEEERLTGHTFVVTASVVLKSFHSSDDNIFDTVNYEHIYRICNEEMAHTRKLIESVAYSIIHRCKEELDNVTSVYIKIEKLGPQLGGRVEKSIIEMEY